MGRTGGEAELDDVRSLEKKNYLRLIMFTVKPPPLKTSASSY